MSEQTPSGYTGGGTSDDGTITGAGGGAGTKGLGGPGEGQHPKAPAPGERRDDDAERDHSSTSGRRNP